MATPAVAENRAMPTPRDRWGDNSPEKISAANETASATSIAPLRTPLMRAAIRWPGRNTSRVRSRQLLDPVLSVFAVAILLAPARPLVKLCAIMPGKAAWGNSCAIAGRRTTVDDRPPTTDRRPTTSDQRLTTDLQHQSHKIPLDRRRARVGRGRAEAEAERTPHGDGRGFVGRTPGPQLKLLGVLCALGVLCVRLFHLHYPSVRCAGSCPETAEMARCHESRSAPNGSFWKR